MHSEMYGFLFVRSVLALNHKGPSLENVKKPHTAMQRCTECEGTQYRTHRGVAHNSLPTRCGSVKR